jgi:hypothetical protein
MEHRYKKKFTKTFETLIDRIGENNSSSSGSCSSGDENSLKNVNKKKRKY